MFSFAKVSFPKERLFQKNNHFAASPHLRFLHPHVRFDSSCAPIRLHRLSGHFHQSSPAESHLHVQHTLCGWQWLSRRHGELGMIFGANMYARIRSITTAIITAMNAPMKLPMHPFAIMGLSGFEPETSRSLRFFPRGFLPKKGLVKRTPCR